MLRWMSPTYQGPFYYADWLWVLAWSLFSLSRVPHGSQRLLLQERWKIALQERLRKVRDFAVYIRIYQSSRSNVAHCQKQGGCGEQCACSGWFVRRKSLLRGHIAAVEVLPRICDRAKSVWSYRCIASSRLQWSSSVFVRFAIELWEVSFPSSNDYLGLGAGIGVAS